MRRLLGKSGSWAAALHMPLHSGANVLKKLRLGFDFYAIQQFES